MSTRNALGRLPSLTGLFIAVLTVSIAMLAGMGLSSLAAGGAAGQAFGTVGLAVVWYALALRPRYDRLP